MLLIFVLLVWAKKPMRFSRGWKKTLVVAATVSAAWLPGWMLDTASTRSRAAAQDGSSPTRSVAGQGIDDAGGYPGAGRGFPRSGDLTSTYGRNSSDPISSSDAARRFREGTLIPPTIGRIAMMGRRWVFIPDEAAGDAAAQTDDAATTTASSWSFQTETRISPFRSTGNGVLTRTRESATTSTQAPGASRMPRLPQILVVENLMLQRLVEAIREDAGDDHWSITGEITEFDGENRLILRSAKQAGE